MKQEPVEIKEPIEADKFKSRYKKFIPPLLPSPVSWIFFFIILHQRLESPWLFAMLSWLLKVLVVTTALLLCRWIWLCV